MLELEQSLLVTRVPTGREALPQVMDAPPGVVRDEGIFAASRFCGESGMLPPGYDELAKKREPGIFGKSADAIVVVDTSAIAGGGPATWAMNNQATLQTIAKELQIPFIKIATSSGRPSFAVEGVTGEFQEPDYLLQYPDNCSLQERYDITIKQVTEAMRELAKKGITNILALSEGYTAIGPLALKIGARQATKESGYKIKMNLLCQDNCIADTDDPSWDIDPQTTMPLGRFFPGAYASRFNVEVFSLGVFGTPVRIGAEAIRARNFPGLQVLETGYNFTPEYIERIQAFYNSLDPVIARDMLQNVVTLPQNTSMPIVNLLRNGIYWNEQPWMTREQQQDVIDGTKTIISALDATARDLQVNRQGISSIAMVVAEEAGIAIEAMGLPVTFDECELSDDRRVLIIPRPEISQTQLLALKKLSVVDIAASRGNNAAVESAVCKRPVLVVQMPAHNYMGVSQMDPDALGYGLAYFDPNANPNRIARLMSQAICSPQYTQALGEKEWRVFTENYVENNFENTLRFLAGAPKKEITLTSL